MTLFDALPRSPSTPFDAVVKATRKKKVKKETKRRGKKFLSLGDANPAVMHQQCVSLLSRSLACSESSLTFNIHQTTKSYGENVPIGDTGALGNFRSNSCVIVVLFHIYVPRPSNDDRKRL